MKRLQTCCCFANTRTGSIIVAVLGILLSIASIIIVWVAPRTIVSFNSWFFSEETEAKYNVSRIIVTISLCFTILICGVLIMAIQKRRSWLMLPWVVLGLVLAIGLLISVIHTSVVYFLADDVENHVLIASLVLVLGLLYLVLYVYLWAVVLSHYMDVRDEEERGRYRKQPYRR